MPLIRRDDLPDDLRAVPTELPSCPYCFLQLPAAHVGLCPGCVRMIGLRCDYCGELAPLDAVDCGMCGEELFPDTSREGAAARSALRDASAVSSAAVRQNRRNLWRIVWPSSASLVALAFGVAIDEFTPAIAALIGVGVVAVALLPGLEAARELRRHPLEQARRFEARTDARHQLEVKIRRASERARVTRARKNRSVPGVTCPQCGKQRAARLAPNALSIGAGLLAVNHARKSYRCEYCKHRW